MEKNALLPSSRTKIESIIEEILDVRFQALMDKTLEIYNAQDPASVDPKLLPFLEQGQVGGHFETWPPLSNRSFDDPNFGKA